MRASRCTPDIAVDAIETDWLSPKLVLLSIDRLTLPPHGDAFRTDRETEK